MNYTVKQMENGISKQLKFKFLFNIINRQGKGGAKPNLGRMLVLPVPLAPPLYPTVHNKHNMRRLVRMVKQLG